MVIVLTHAAFVALPRWNAEFSDFTSENTK
jgi:hypothetical protein